MFFNKNNIKIFSGNSNLELAEGIAKELHLPLGKSCASIFSDGEIAISLNETVRGCDCFIVQSTCAPVNDNLMELLILTDALKRASANRIVAVIPYFGYARQERKASKYDPITAKLVADLMTTAGVNEVLTMDLHAPQIEGFFNIPVTNVEGLYVLASKLKNELLKDTIEDYVVVSPDLGSVKRARKFAKELGNLGVAIINKFRPRPNECEVSDIFGTVKNKNVIILDDMIDTAGTLCNAAEFLLEEGARSVVACASHGVLSGEAINRLEKSGIKNICLLNTIPFTEKLNKIRGKLKFFSTSRIFADAILDMCGDAKS